MSVVSDNSVEHKTRWAMKLLILLQEMVADDTNAIQQLMCGVDRIETEQRYPESGLLFAGECWRVFYHCHDDNKMHADEHGHFHVFTDIGKGDWAHVVGLSIDDESQPLQWFTVNRWVTDGPWFESAQLFERLDAAILDQEHETLTGSWLYMLLQLYREELHDLLVRRDERMESQEIKRQHRKKFKQSVFEDREIYNLSVRQIDLKKTLEYYLLSDQVSDVVMSDEHVR